MYSKITLPSFFCGRSACLAEQGKSLTETSAPNNDMPIPIIYNSIVNSGKYWEIHGSVEKVWYWSILIENE